MLVDIPICPYCSGMIYFNEQSAEMPGGELWHKRCALTHNRPLQPRCRHPQRPEQSHLGLPCPWPDCPEGHQRPEFYLPIADKERALFIPDAQPPRKPENAIYKRVASYVPSLAQVSCGMPERIYQWVPQTTERKLR